MIPVDELERLSSPIFRYPAGIDVWGRNQWKAQIFLDGHIVIIGIYDSMKNAQIATLEVYYHLLRQGKTPLLDSKLPALAPNLEIPLCDGSLLSIPFEITPKANELESVDPSGADSADLVDQNGETSDGEESDPELTTWSKFLFSSVKEIPQRGLIHPGIPVYPNDVRFAARSIMYSDGAVPILCKNVDEDNPDSLYSVGYSSRDVSYFQSSIYGDTEGMDELLPVPDHLISPSHIVGPSPLVGSKKKPSETTFATLCEIYDRHFANMNAPPGGSCKCDQCQSCNADVKEAMSTHWNMEFLSDTHYDVHELYERDISAIIGDIDDDDEFMISYLETEDIKNSSNMVVRRSSEDDSSPGLQSAALIGDMEGGEKESGFEGLQFISDIDGVMRHFVYLEMCQDMETLRNTPEFTETSRVFLDSVVEAAESEHVDSSYTSDFADIPMMGMETNSRDSVLALMSAVTAAPEVLFDVNGDEEELSSDRQSDTASDCNDTVDSDSDINNSDGSSSSSIDDNDAEIDEDTSIQSDGIDFEGISTNLERASGVEDESEIGAAHARWRSNFSSPLILLDLDCVAESELGFTTSVDLEFEHCITYGLDPEEALLRTSSVEDEEGQEQEDEEDYDEGEEEIEEEHSRYNRKSRRTLMRNSDDGYSIEDVSDEEDDRSDDTEDSERSGNDDATEDEEMEEGCETDELEETEVGAEETISERRARIQQQYAESVDICGSLMTSMFDSSSMGTTEVLLSAEITTSTLIRRALAVLSPSSFPEASLALQLPAGVSRADLGPEALAEAALLFTMIQGRWETRFRLISRTLEGEIHSAAYVSTQIIESRECRADWQLYGMERTRWYNKMLEERRNSRFTSAGISLDNSDGSVLLGPNRPSIRNRMSLLDESEEPSMLPLLSAPRMSLQLHQYSLVCRPLLPGPSLAAQLVFFARVQGFSMQQFAQFLGMQTAHLLSWIAVSDVARFLKPLPLSADAPGPAGRLPRPGEAIHLRGMQELRARRFQNIDGSELSSLLATAPLSASLPQQRRRLAQPSTEYLSGAVLPLLPLGKPTKTSGDSKESKTEKEHPSSESTDFIHPEEPIDVNRGGAVPPIIAGAMPLPLWVQINARVAEFLLDNRLQNSDKLNKTYPSLEWYSGEINPRWDVAAKVSSSATLSVMDTLKAITNRKKENLRNLTSQFLKMIPSHKRADRDLYYKETTGEFSKGNGNRRSSLRRQLPSHASSAKKSDRGRLLPILGHYQTMLSDYVRFGQLLGSSCIEKDTVGAAGATKFSAFLENAHYSLTEGLLYTSASTDNLEEEIEEVLGAISSNMCAILYHRSVPIELVFENESGDCATCIDDHYDAAVADSLYGCGTSECLNDVCLPTYQQDVLNRSGEAFKVELPTSTFSSVYTSFDDSNGSLGALEEELLFNKMIEKRNEIVENVEITSLLNFASFEITDYDWVAASVMNKENSRFGSDMSLSLKSTFVNVSEDSYCSVKSDIENLVKYEEELMNIGLYQEDSKFREGNVVAECWDLIQYDSLGKMRCSFDNMQEIAPHQEVMDIFHIDEHQQKQLNQWVEDSIGELLSMEYDEDECLSRESDDLLFVKDHILSTKELCISDLYSDFDSDSSVDIKSSTGMLLSCVPDGDIGFVYEYEDCDSLKEEDIQQVFDDDEMNSDGDFGDDELSSSDLDEPLSQAGDVDSSVCDREPREDQLVDILGKLHEYVAYDLDGSDSSNSSSIGSEDEAEGEDEKSDLLYQMSTHLDLDSFSFSESSFSDDESSSDESTFSDDSSSSIDGNYNLVMEEGENEIVLMHLVENSIVAALEIISPDDTVTSNLRNEIDVEGRCELRGAENHSAVSILEGDVRNFNAGPDSENILAKSQQSESAESDIESDISIGLESERGEINESSVNEDGDSDCIEEFGALNNLIDLFHESSDSEFEIDIADYEELEIMSNSGGDGSENLNTDDIGLDESSTTENSDVDDSTVSDGEEYNNEEEEEIYEGVDKNMYPEDLDTVNSSDEISSESDVSSENVDTDDENNDSNRVSDEEDGYEDTIDVDSHNFELDDEEEEEIACAKTSSAQHSCSIIDSYYSDSIDNEEDGDDISDSCDNDDDNSDISSDVDDINSDDDNDNSKDDDDSDIGSDDIDDDGGGETEKDAKVRDVDMDDDERSDSLDRGEEGNSDLDEDGSNGNNHYELSKWISENVEDSEHLEENGSINSTNENLSDEWNHGFRHNRSKSSSTHTDIIDEGKECYECVKNDVNHDGYSTGSEIDEIEAIPRRAFRVYRNYSVDNEEEEGVILGLLVSLECYDEYSEDTNNFSCWKRRSYTNTPISEIVDLEKEVFIEDKDKAESRCTVCGIGVEFSAEEIASAVCMAHCIDETHECLLGIHADCICSPASENFNDSLMHRLLYCSRCSIKVHERCYGICTPLTTTECENWLCNSCAHLEDNSPPIQRVCQLCGCVEGGLIMTNTMDSRHVHVICAVTTPLLKYTFGYRNTMTGMDLSIIELIENSFITNASAHMKELLSIRCSLCNEGQTGVLRLVKCCFDNCGEYLHASCALQSGHLTAAHYSMGWSHDFFESVDGSEYMESMHDMEDILFCSPNRRLVPPLHNPETAGISSDIVLNFRWLPPIDFPLLKARQSCCPSSVLIGEFCSGYEILLEISNRLEEHHFSIPSILNILFILKTRYIDLPMEYSDLNSWSTVIIALSEWYEIEEDILTRTSNLPDSLKLKTVQDSFGADSDEYMAALEKFSDEYLSFLEQNPRLLRQLYLNQNLTNPLFPRSELITYKSLCQTHSIWKSTCNRVVGWGAGTVGGQLLPPWSNGVLKDSFHENVNDNCIIEKRHCIWPDNLVSDNGNLFANSDTKIWSIKKESRKDLMSILNNLGPSGQNQLIQKRRLLLNSTSVNSWWASQRNVRALHSIIDLFPIPKDMKEGREFDESYFLEREEDEQYDSDAEIQLPTIEGGSSMIIGAVRNKDMKMYYRADGSNYPNNKLRYTTMEISRFMPLSSELYDIPRFNIDEDDTYGHCGGMRQRKK